MTAHTEIVAVRDLDPNLCGAMVFWSLSGAIDAGRLEEVWTEAGLDASLLPTTPSPDSALRLAVKEMASKRILVRQLEAGAGWALVNEKAVGDDLDYAVILRVKVDRVGRLSFEEGPAWTNDDRDKIRIEAAYMRHLDEIPQNGVSGWLVSLIERCQAVSLRPTGGFYFVPRYNLATWRSYVEAIRTATDNALYEIPAMTSEEAAQAVFEAVTAEAERAAAAMEEELEHGTLGARALANRAANCEAVASKLRGYEELLGIHQEKLRDRLGTLTADLAAAALAAGGDDQ